MAKRKFDTEHERLIDTFADVFHSFEDLHKVSPAEFLEKLEKAGVTLAVVGSPADEREGRS
jgi:hypothetical protein